MFIALFFAANLLFCLAYIVRDMAWLRAITILAASCTLPYFYFQPAPLYSAMGWQIAFILINGINLIILLLERRPVALSEAEQQLHNLTFRNLTPREMLKLLDRARWEKAAPGSRLVQHNEDLGELMLIYDGIAEVRVDGQFRANLGPGDFVGEMSFATGNPTSADVDVPDEAVQPLVYLRWPHAELRQLLDRQPGIKDAVQAILGVDMAKKLSR